MEKLVTELEDRRFYVYAYFDPRTGVIFYVGKGQGRRAWAHTGPYELKRKDPFHNKLRGMNRKGIEPIVLILSGDLTNTEALELETLLITTIGRRDLGTGPLLNLTDGGEGMSGTKISESHREKIAESNRKRGQSQATREKLSALNKGKKASKATRDKMSKSRTGKVCKDESKAKIAKASRLRSGRSVTSTDPATGETRTYETMSDAAREGFRIGHIWSCCNGRRKKHGGLLWSYTEQEQPTENQ